MPLMIINNGVIVASIASIPVSYPLDSSLFPLDIGKYWQNVYTGGDANGGADSIYVGGGVYLFSTISVNHIYRSTDWGKSWNDLGAITNGNSGFFVNFGNGIVTVADTNGHIFRSTNSGSVWADLGAMAGNPDMDDGIYLGNGIGLYGTYTSGHIFRSTNWGANWSDLGLVTEANGADCNFVYLDNGKVLQGGLGGKIWVSNDYGQTWASQQIVPGGSAGHDDIISMIQLSKKIVLAASWSNNILYKSTDAGANWSQISTLGRYIYRGSSAYVGNGVFIVADSGGHIVKSVDYGQTTNDLGALLSNYPIRIAYGGEGIFITVTGDCKVWRSDVAYKLDH